MCICCCTFTVWFNRVLLPAKAPDAHFTELNDLNEVNTMLAERVKQWTKEWKQEGRQEGRQEEATKLFLLLLESKFGAINQQLGYQFKAGQINKTGLLIPGALSPSSA